MLTALVLGRVSTLMLVMARLAGFVVTSPFPGAHVQSSTKVVLVLVLAWPVALTADGGFGAPTLALVPLTLSELGAGIAMGLAFRFTLSSADLVGTMAAQSIGLNAASMFDPATEAHDSAVSRTISLFALSFALAIGAHRVVIAAVLESFRVIPLGTVAPLSQVARSLIDLAAECFAAGLRMSLPVAGLALVVQMALAMVSRAAPTLQLFSIGWPMLLLTGLATLRLSVGDLARGLAAELGALPARIELVWGSLAGG